MRIIHFSDTHLGFSEYTRIDPATGLNLREADVYRGFFQVTDYIKKNPPDVIVHSGDLFESPRPSNRAIAIALKEIAEISHLKIPFILLSGNHSTPRIRSSGSIFETFKLFDHIYPVYETEPREITIKGVTFHCVPHIPTEEEFHNAFSKLKPDSHNKNVIITHTGITAETDFRMGEFNELILPYEEIKAKRCFDYIALGHYHKYHPVALNAFYSGSTERFSFREAGYDKGFIDVDLDNRIFKFVPIKTREMIEITPVDCAERGVREIEDLIEKLSKGKIKDKIVQITFNNLTRQIYVAIDFQRLKEITSDAVYVKFIPNFAEEAGKIATLTTIRTLSAEFNDFIDNQKIKDLDKDKLKEIGNKYLSMAIDSEEV